MSPPENELPVNLPLTVVLARTPDAAVALTGVRVYSAGVSLHLSVRVRVRRGAIAMSDLHQLLWRHGEGPPALLLGLELPDGGRVDNIARHGPMPDVVFTQGSGSGNELSVDQEWWLSPLPLDGPITVVVRCAELGIGETRTEFDGSVLRRAAEDVVELWPWTPPGPIRAELSPPPDLPD